MEVSPGKSARTEKRGESVDKQQSVKMIKVTAIPPGVSSDYITFFFENKRKSGGGDIDYLDYDQESQTAIITFEEEEVAERVVNKMPLLLDKKLINVELYTPVTQIEEEDEQSTGYQEVGDKPTEYAIEVRGTKPTTSEEAVMLYFEGRRGANEDVVKIVFVEKENMYIVWFEKEEAIEVILNKSHKLDGQIMKVKRYIPPKPVPKYDNKVFLTNISPTTTKDMLEIFLEAKSKVIPTETIFGEVEGTALVTFDNPPDIAKLQAACTKRPLEDSHLKIHSVPITDCVVVTGFRENTSQDTLEFYFDNKRRSGVEGVTNINLKKDEGQCFISYSHPDSALEVCKREHKIEGHVLQVQVYYECLGQPAIDEDGPKFKPVKELFIPNLNSKKIEFAMNCKEDRETFEKQLSTHHALVVWPDRKDIGDTLEVRCTLTKKVKDCRKLAKTWAKNVTVETEKFFDMLDVNIQETLQETWEDVMGHIRNINISNPESVAIQVIKKEFKIIIVGHKIPTDEVSEKVGDIIKNVAIELDQKKLQVTEEVRLKHYQLLILLYLHFIDKMKQQFEGLNAVPDMKKHCMNFTGMSGQVTAAKVKLLEQIQKIVGTSAGRFSNGFIQYLKTRLVKSFLGQQFKQNRVLGVWDIQEDNVIMMYSLSDEGVVTAVSVLKKSIKEVPIILDSKEAALVGMKMWAHEVNVIETEYKNALVKITVVDANTVVIYLTSSVDEGLLMEKVRDIFFKHAVSEEIVKLPSTEIRLLQEQYNTETNKLVEVFSREHVKLRIDNTGIFIQGNVMGVASAKQKIDEMVKSIYKKNYTLNKTGIVRYMHSDPGRSKITLIEKMNKVVIEMNNTDDSDDEARESVHTGTSRSTWTETAVCNTPTGQTITTVVGDITDFSVDVIVNAANKELQHVGGLSKVIVDKGGEGIQKECDAHVSTKNRQKQMYEGEIFCSSPGNLNCKMIAHAVGPVWQGGHNREEEYLSECIQASLKRTEKKKYQSIAIPALCTGIFGYPADKATKVIVESIRDFLKESGRTTFIRQIYLCDVKNVDHFVAALERFYGKASVTKQRGRSNVSIKNKRHALDNESKYGHGSLKRHTTTASSHISITLVKGQIASQKVDVLVNTTSSSLQLNQGAVSQSLLKMGGPGLQSECSQKYPNGIQYREVAETSGAKLECKLVYHGALPQWNDGSSAKVMEYFMKTCLQKASDKGFVSIAFPALGTGNLGYPKNVVARNMFSCVEWFSTSYPGTSVCDVRFVVYEKDMNTIQAFEEEQRKHPAGKHTGRTARNFDSKKSKDYSEDIGASGGLRHEAMDTYKQASVDIGDLTLKVYQGDITEASVDVIVNGTNRDLDLTRGAVSQAIAKKGGDELSKLLRVPSTKKEMRKEGITITSAGGRLRCEYIIHVDMEDSRPDLKTKFKDVLEKVDELNKETVALPALGAGISATSNIQKVADHLFEALINFQKKTTAFTEVHVVIFQADMLSKFLSAIQSCLSSHNAKPQGLLNRFKGLIGYSDKNPVKGNEWKVSKMPLSSINIVVYGKTQGSTDTAFRSLEDSMDSDFKEKVVEDPVVENLTKDQEGRIKKLEVTCEVDIELNKRLGRITIRGLPENLSEAIGNVHQIILDVDRQKQKYEQAQLVQGMVQWYFISVEATGQTLKEYPLEVNLTLEKALKNNEPQAFFCDDDNKYIVDFTTYKEFPEDDPKDTVVVLRKSKMTDSAFDMPSNWTAMDDSENVKIVTLQPSDQEYTDVTKDFQTQIGANYSTILKVEKIQNRTLQQQYVAKKKLMDSTNQVGHNNERRLWHGTAIDAVDSINTYGFNRSYCGTNAVVYGNGVYFAVNPAYSARPTYARPDPNGHKRMYICKVLVGEFTQGKTGMKVPPPKAGAAGSHILYDSVVDDLAAPGIFVIFHDTQAYPEYLIVFK